MQSTEFRARLSPCTAVYELKNRLPVGAIILFQAHQTAVVKLRADFHGLYLHTPPLMCTGGGVFI